MDDKGAVVAQWRPSDCNEGSGIGPFTMALNSNVGIRIAVGRCSALVLFESNFGLLLHVFEQFPGDMAKVYFACDGLQHMFVQVVT